jgi:site-specific DNA-methyltransferase (adenine-specific)
MRRISIDTPDVYTIHQGDAYALLRTVPTESIDAVITDPPYSSGGIALSARQADPSHKYQEFGTKKTYPPMLGDGKDQRAFTAWATVWLAECWRAAKPGAPLLLFTDWRQLPAMTDALQGAGWFWLGIVPWVKRSSRPQIGKFRQQCEYVLFGSRGRFVPAVRDCLPGVYDCPVIPQEKRHIAGKPVSLLRSLMAITPRECLILDPFTGSGSTAVAALETGRRFVGMELSPEYAAIALERCRATIAGQTPLKDRQARPDGDKNAARGESF